MLEITCSLNERIKENKANLYKLPICGLLTSFIVSSFYFFNGILTPIIVSITFIFVMFTFAVILCIRNLPKLKKRYAFWQAMEAEGKTVYMEDLEAEKKRLIQQLMEINENLRKAGQLTEAIYLK